MKPISYDFSMKPIEKSLLKEQLEGWSKSIG